MPSKTLIRMAATLAVLFGLSVGAQAACKFEVEEPTAKETKVFVIARGMNTGLSGHLGRSGDRFYLRGRFFSQYAATPSFDRSTPLQLTFADGSSIALQVLEGAEGRLNYNPMLANNREAVPVFAIDSVQLSKIKQGTVTAVRVNRIVKQELGSKDYKVGAKAARKLAEAARCVSE